MTTLDAEITGRRVKRADLARELGVSRQAVSELVRRQILQVDADGMLDLDAARAVIRERVRPSGKTAAAVAPVAPAAAPAANQAALAKTDPAAGYYVAKANREASEAGMAALKLEQMQGKLIDRDSAIHAAFTAFRQLRNSLGFLPRKLGGVLVNKATPREIQLRIEDELRKVLEDFQQKVLASMAGRMGSQLPVDEGDGA